MHSVSKSRIDKLAKRLRSSRIAKKLYDTYIVCCEYRNQLGTLGIVSAWTLLEQLAPIAGIALMVRALHINVSVLQ